MSSPSMVGSEFPKEDVYERRYSLPVLVGPHQGRNWVKQFEKLTLPYYITIINI